MNKKPTQNQAETDYKAVQISHFDDAKSVEKIIKQKQIEGYKLSFFSTPWLIFTK